MVLSKLRCCVNWLWQNLEMCYIFNYSTENRAMFVPFGAEMFPRGLDNHVRSHEKRINARPEACLARTFDTLTVLKPPHATMRLVGFHSKRGLRPFSKLMM